MLKHGTHHVYFGRGELLRNNPGNIRFRRIVDQYYEELRVSSQEKECKAEIRKEIEKKVERRILLPCGERQQNDSKTSPQTCN